MLLMTISSKLCRTTPSFAAKAARVFAARATHGARPTRHALRRLVWGSRSVQAQRAMLAMGGWEDGRTDRVERQLERALDDRQQAAGSVKPRRAESGPDTDTAAYTRGAQRVVHSHPQSRTELFWTGRKILVFEFAVWGGPNLQRTLGTSSLIT